MCLVADAGNGKYRVEDPSQFGSNNLGFNFSSFLILTTNSERERKVVISVNDLVSNWLTFANSWVVNLCWLLGHFQAS